MVAQSPIDILKRLRGVYSARYPEPDELEPDVKCEAPSLQRVRESIWHPARQNQLKAKYVGTKSSRRAILQAHANYDKMLRDEC
jgi:hypothetical protein